MKKSGRGKRLFLFILTAAMILTMQDFSVLAGQVPLENGAVSQTGPATEQPESQSEAATEQPESQSGAATEQPESQPGAATEQPVSQPGQPEGGAGMPGETPETPSELPPAGEASGKPEEQPDGGSGMTAEQSEGGDGTVNVFSTLDGDILAEHIIRDSQNPDQAVVNLFDYWQYSGDSMRYGNEIAHDYWTDDNTKKDAVTTYNTGISKEHLLRFGYREIEPDGTRSHCEYCFEEGNYGDWNEYCSTGPYSKIVQNKLGEDGFPCLNFANKDTSFFENYNTVQDSDKYLSKKEESLAYLFSPNVNVVDSNGGAFKASYTNVQGLFRMNKDGYYYYDSQKNFAEFDGNSQFILYDSPGAADSKGHYGQFFPFNKAEDVFDAEYEGTDGKRYLHYQNTASDKNIDPISGENNYAPVDDNGVGFIKCYAPGMNHYLGMTLEVPFLQPVGGKLPNGNSMQFTFSGDDDVWIFIDGVLVADLGGLHDAYGLSINFETGVVTVNGKTHTLLESFRDAYPEDASGWNPGGVAFAANTDTFADNTVHTLKMFYLERGNVASNLSLSFNLQTARYNQIKKVDQNGNAVENVEFVLYPAAICSAGDEGSLLCNSIANTVNGTSCYVKQNGDTPLLTLKTGPDGMVDLSDYTFSSASQFYILHETVPPAGYRSQPVDIVLEYNPDTTMLSVANRWETGAYASFTSYVSEQPGTALHYGEYRGNGVIGATQSEVPEQSRKDGLVLAVPMLRRGEKDSGVWLPLYGSNLDGFHTTGVEGTDEESMKRALLTAALNQCLYDEGWYLEWNSGKSILEGRLSDLPGRADRYLHVDENGGDMQMAYIILEPDVFTMIGGAGGSSLDPYAALKQYVAVKGIDAAVSEIYDSTGGNTGADVNLLDTKQFSRVFRSLIYISNEQRELRVMKVDENGQPLNGARFGLYASMEDAQQNRNAVAEGVTANVDGVDGILIFRPQTDGDPGYARMVWANAPDQLYYLKEISAPKGYKVNKTIIPVVVGIYSVYADAGSADNGVSVMAGAGQLYRTMSKYASDGDVNITLRDITATAQRQDSGQFALNGWQDMEESGQKQEKNLHYGINSEMGMDYGLHDEDLDSTPFFKTDIGFLRVRVSQNTQALQNELYNGAVNIANWDDLADTDLTGLFSLLNIVVVEDWPGQDSDEDNDNDSDSGMEDTTPDDSGTTDMNPDTGAKASPTALNVLVERIGTPQTGDDSLITWWALLSIISLVGIGATVCNLIFVKRKQKEHPPKEKHKERSLKKKQKEHSSKRKHKKRSSKK